MVRPAGDAVAIHVETNGEVAGRGGAQRAIEEQALERENGQEQAGSFELHRVAQAGQRACQYVNAHVGAAAAADIERSRGEEANTHRATIIV